MLLSLFHSTTSFYSLFCQPLWRLLFFFSFSELYASLLFNVCCVCCCFFSFFLFMPAQLQMRSCACVLISFAVTFLIHSHFSFQFCFLLFYFWVFGYWVLKFIKFCFFLFSSLIKFPLDWSDDNFVDFRLLPLLFLCVCVSECVGGCVFVWVCEKNDREEQRVFIS